MGKFSEETSTFAEISGVGSPGDINITNVQIARKTYILTIGFEVNHPDAFADGVQDLSIDYGHAFFYITKNGIVTVFFSFGPKGLAAPGKITDEYSGARPGNTSYGITEVTRLFRLKISEEMAGEVRKLTNIFTEKVNAGSEHYYAFMNDTCAETARDMLIEGGVTTPPGSGPIKGVGADGFTTTGSFVNPYKWYDDFSKEYNDGGIICYGPEGRDNVDNNLFTLYNSWVLHSGDNDVLISTSQEKIVHGDVTEK
ncbi:hypothetical protein [Raoultella terrigena]|uniref:hypothetical protein n=1 Tax=Raoultella terrigena TaxID=577 RepID=UPI00385132E6